jgi:hypothetical protein
MGDNVARRLIANVPDLEDGRMRLIPMRTVTFIIEGRK